MANTYKDDIASLDNDYSVGVQKAYDAAKQQLAQVNTANLEGTDRALPQDLGNKLDSTFTQFAQAKQQKSAEITPKKEALKKRHLIFLLVQLALIVLGLIIAFKAGGDSAGMFGWLMLIAGIVCHFIFSSMDKKAAAALAQEWRSLFGAYHATFGHKETLHQSASGLYKDVDELYLRSLDPQQRGFEMQNRQLQKQMEAQNEQHEQAMAMQAAQMKQMQSMIDEQRNTNAMLRG